METPTPVTAVPLEAAPEPPIVVGEPRLGDAHLHWTLLCLSAAVLLSSLILQVPAETAVRVPVVQIPLPEVCSYKRLTGKDCPGCGLTRCFISLAHGQWQRAWNFNPAGIYFFFIVAAQIPYRALQLWRLNCGRAELSPKRLTTFVLVSLISALLAQWFIRALG